MGIIGGLLGLIGGSSAAHAAKKAAAQARKDSAAQAAANERAINQANQKKPSIFNATASNILQNSSGIGSTMLTGPGGVPTGTLGLGRNTLLGQ